MVENDGEANIDFPNMRLVKFGIQTQMSLIDNIRKTCRKWDINDLIEGGHNNLITSLIINIRAEFSSDIEDCLSMPSRQIWLF